MQTFGAQSQRVLFSSPFVPPAANTSLTIVDSHSFRILRLALNEKINEVSMIVLTIFESWFT
jgi:hypothetical protein